MSSYRSLKSLGRRFGAAGTSIALLYFTTSATVSHCIVTSPLQLKEYLQNERVDELLSANYHTNI
jgi:hypothetical protein